MAKFTFPVPGKRVKPAVHRPSAISGPLTKAQRILGTGEINIDSPTLPRADRPWEDESNSGMSISISESSLSRTETGLGIVEEVEDNGTTTGVISQGNRWEQDSDVIPVPRITLPGSKRRNEKRPRMQRSMSSVQDYHTIDVTSGGPSTISRRESTSSTILSHYDRFKVPLAISQQTSSSAMAKGLPCKADALLNPDENSSATPADHRKKPGKLDLSVLRTKSRLKVSHPNMKVAGPILGNEYVMSSPSNLSVASNAKESASPTTSHRVHKRGLAKAQGTQAGILSRSGDYPNRRRISTETKGLNQLYDHYEQMAIRGMPSPVEENDHGSETESTGQQRHATEPSPPMTLPYAFTNDQAHGLKQPPSHRRTGSKASHETANTNDSGNPHPSVPSRLLSRREYASSTSSRNTANSKTSRVSGKSLHDTNLGKTSILALTDSESSEEDEFSGVSEPKSSMSSRDEMAVSPEFGQMNSKNGSIQVARGPHIGKSQAKKNTFGLAGDFLTIPQRGSSQESGTLTTTSGYNSFETSTTTAISSSNARHLSVQSTSSEDSFLPLANRPTSQANYVVQEAKAVAIMPLAAMSELDAVIEPAMTIPALPQGSLKTAISNAAPGLFAHLSQQINLTGEERMPTPPRSPNSEIPEQINLPDILNEEEGDDLQGSEEASRMMAVTRQEEMLLAALRLRRARMRENIIAEIEGEARSIRSEKGSIVSGDSSQYDISSFSRDVLEKRHDSIQQVGIVGGGKIDSQGPLSMNETGTLKGSGSSRPAFPSRSSSLATITPKLTCSNPAGTPHPSSNYPSPDQNPTSPGFNPRVDRRSSSSLEFNDGEGNSANMQCYTLNMEQRPFTATGIRGQSSLTETQSALSHIANSHTRRGSSDATTRRKIVNEAAENGIRVDLADFMNDHGSRGHHGGTWGPAQQNSANGTEPAATSPRGQAAPRKGKRNSRLGSTARSQDYKKQPRSPRTPLFQVPGLLGVPESVEEIDTAPNHDVDADEDSSDDGAGKESPIIPGLVDDREDGEERLEHDFPVRSSSRADHRDFPPLLSANHGSVRLSAVGASDGNV